MAAILRSKLLSIFLSLFAFASVAYPQAEKTLDRASLGGALGQVTITQLTTMIGIDSPSTPTNTFGGSQFSITRVGSNYVSAVTTRSHGEEWILTCPVTTALTSPNGNFTAVKVGQGARGTPFGHNINGSGGIAYNGTDTLIRTIGAGYHGDSNDAGELLSMVYDLAPRVNTPLVDRIQVANLRVPRIQTKFIADNTELDLNPPPAVRLSPGGKWICLGRAVVAFPETSCPGDEIIVEKGSGPFVLILTNNTIIWTDNVEHTRGFAFQDNSTLHRTYVLTRLRETGRWRVTCSSSEIQQLSSENKLLLAPGGLDRTDTLASFMNLWSGRNMMTRREDFTGGRTATGTIGENSWNQLTLGGSIIASDVEYGYPGIVKLTSGTPTLGATAKVTSIEPSTAPIGVVTTRSLNGAGGEDCGHCDYPG